MALDRTLTIARWDTDTATVVIASTALLFLWMVRRGFRGLLG